MVVMMILMMMMVMMMTTTFCIAHSLHAVVVSELLGSLGVAGWLNR